MGRVFAATETAPSEPYQVGRYWEYTLEGPRPGAMEPKAIDGRRIVQVLGQTGTEAEARWVIEERYSNDPNVVSRLHLRDDRMVTALVIANVKKESLTLAYDSPVPYQLVDLEVGGKIQFKTAMVTHPGDYRMPITVDIERLADETVETPAGRFDKCRHYSSTTESLFNIKIATIAMKEHRQWWTSDQVGATVKEIYRKEPIKFGFWSKEGYTATSTLAAFGVGEVGADALATVALDADNANVASPASRPAPNYWKAVVGGAVCVAACGFILARRRKRVRNG